MNDELTHNLVELGLQLNQIKQRIAALHEEERATTDPEEIAELQKERQSLENKRKRQLKAIWTS